MSGFEQFRQRVMGVAESRCQSSMSLPELDEALREAAVCLVRAERGAETLLASYPELRDLEFDTSTLLWRGKVSAGSVVDAVAVSALVSVMKPVRMTTISDAFDEGYLAAVEQLARFVAEARPHARGTISQELVDGFNYYVEDVLAGDVDIDETEKNLFAVNRALRMLAILEDGSRIATALGGKHVIVEHAKIAERLMALYTDDPKDLVKWIGEEAAEFRLSAAPKP